MQPKVGQALNPCPAHHNLYDYPNHTLLDNCIGNLSIKDKNSSHFNRFRSLSSLTCLAQSSAFRKPTPPAALAAGNPAPRAPSAATDSSPHPHVAGALSAALRRPLDGRLQVGRGRVRGNPETPLSGLLRGFAGHRRAPPNLPISCSPHVPW